jgi:hypothetical protein
MLLKLLSKIYKGYKGKWNVIKILSKYNKKSNVYTYVKDLTTNPRVSGLQYREECFNVGKSELNRTIDYKNALLIEMLI